MRTPLLDRITAIDELRRLPEADLQRLADELRAETISAVSKQEVILALDLAL